MRKSGVCIFTYLFVPAIWFLILFFNGCAAPKIKTSMLVPAKAHEAGKLRRIAVLPFAGSGANQVCTEAEALLVNIRVSGKPYFEVIERASLENIMREQKLHLTGAVEEETAVAVGKLVGAEGIILGTVTTNAAEDKHFSQKRSKCEARDKEGKCIKRREYMVRCITRDAYFCFTPKVINVATGRIVASESLSGHIRDSVCQDSGRPLRGRVQMLGYAKKRAIRKFRELIAPYSVMVEIALLEKDDTKPPPKAKEKVASGIKWAKQGRLERACEFWQEAYKLHPQGYAIHYLLGVCAETQGKLQKALEYYEKADRMTGSPVKEINTALGRVRVSLEKRKKLEEQLQIKK
jgi:hypothetical protein